MDAVRPRLRPVVLALAVVASAVLALPSFAVATPCEPDSARSDSIRALRLGLRCLINSERARSGLRPLRPNGALARAARTHAHDLVARRYVSHYSKAGEGPASRAAGAGYPRGTSRWSVGENIGWLGDRRDPAWIVSAWMNSPAHRHVLLRPSFHEVGIGIVRSSPSGDGRGLTIVVDFGARSLVRRVRTVALFRKAGSADGRASGEQQVVEQGSGQAALEQGAVDGL
jgi:uncharacterized protein YkwD